MEEIIRRKITRLNDHVLFLMGCIYYEGLLYELFNHWLEYPALAGDPEANYLRGWLEAATEICRRMSDLDVPLGLSKATRLCLCLPADTTPVEP